MIAESVEANYLKLGIRPENLRIKAGCEVRVELSVTEEEIVEFLSEVGEVWVRTFSNGAGINRLIDFPDEGSDWRHTGVITETAGLLFDSIQWRNVWAVQRNDASGSKSFFLDVAGREGLVQQFELTPRSKFEAFQNLVTQYQTDGNLSASGESTSGGGFLEFIEKRWRKTLSSGKGARRVDRTSVPNFILQLVRANTAFRITILNSAVKQTADVRISNCRVLGSEVMLEGADFLFEWDNACVEEAWMVQCGCNCGDEILELYDPHKRLVASMALQGLPHSISHLLPALN
jgi:hypothetical protein